ncbi:MAG: glycosyltransferase family 4 protein [Pyrinomonadaceae bacterium]
MMTKWIIIAGEYPPQFGGVSDYTYLLARGLNARGDEVHVFAPSCAQGKDADLDGIFVHRLKNKFGLRAVVELNSAVEQIEKPYRILVQYVPHSYGWRAMNLPFCLWLYSRFHRQLEVMFHEVAVGIRSGQPLRHNIIGAVHRVMATLICSAAKDVYVATPAWSQILKVPTTWLPVPSNIETDVDREEIISARARYVATSTAQDAVLIGHFGTYRRGVKKLLFDTLPQVLKNDKQRMGLLIGRGSEPVRDELLRLYPGLNGRVVATGGQPSRSVATALSACDVLLQPYPSGISCNRGSAMAGLALGCAIVSNAGEFTEPVWQTSGAVKMAASTDAAKIINAMEEVLASTDNVERLRRQSADLYSSRFAIKCTIDVLCPH